MGKKATNTTPAARTFCTRGPHRGAQCRRIALLSLATALLVLVIPGATAHEERSVTFPTAPGGVPRYRTGGPTLLVCKKDTPRRIRRLPARMQARNLRLYRRCERNGFRHIQAAIDAVRTQGTRILVLPGVYREQPSLRRQSAECRALADDRPLSYRQQRACPHLENLIAIFGDGRDQGRACDRERLCRLQIEGTARRKDVVIENDFNKLNALRADRGDGIYLRNFTAQNTEFNSIYILETDGFVIDRLVARWNLEYGFLTYGSDHGLYKRCEAYGNGDGGLYPGSAAGFHGARHSIEIRHCKSHHNLIGLSGTAGNSLWVHHNRFYANSAGVTLDSFFPGHPGLPQNSAIFAKNLIHSNNQDYYKYWDDGTCRRPLRRIPFRKGVVCPTAPVPIGTGVIVAGGNWNTFRLNWIYDNWRYGTMQFWVPAAVRDEHDPQKQYDTSHYNRYVHNRMGFSWRGEVRVNGLDFWWDEEGEGNCWERNRSRSGGIRSDPQTLPPCDPEHSGAGTFSTGNSAKHASIVSCATWSPDNNHPPGCDWMDPPPKPSGR